MGGESLTKTKEILLKCALIDIDVIDITNSTTIRMVLSNALTTINNAKDCSDDEIVFTLNTLLMFVNDVSDELRTTIMKTLEDQNVEFYLTLESIAKNSYY